MKLSHIGLMPALAISFNLACSSTDDAPLDADNDKVADAIGKAVDANLDGVADLVDLNNDGNIDGIGVDTDGDGQADAIGLDTDGDGILDALDRDLDGKPDGSQNAGTGGSFGGTGGSSGTGGGLTASGGSTAGTGGVGTSTGGGTSDGGCKAADILCVDFEDTSAGSKPSGTPWEADGCTGQSYEAAVQSGVGVGASQGFVTKSPGSASENSCALQYKLTPPSEYYVTAHVMITGTSPDAQHEVTFFELGEVPGDDPELRIGYRGDSSCNNSGAVYAGFELGATQGPGGEFTGCTGNKPVADTWYCIEVHVTETADGITADMSVNGDDQSYLVHSKPHDDVQGTFVPSYLKVGMQSYSGNFDGLVIDNVSVSTTPVGCE